MRSSLLALKRTWETLRASVRTINSSDTAVAVVGLALAVAVRVPLLSFRSADFFNSIKAWYTTIHGMGFAAFGTDFSTYNPPYLYELYLIARFFPNLSNVLAIKVPSLIGDFVAAYFVYKIVALRYSRSLFPLLAAFAFLFAPTVVLNSAFWGQADILFTAPLIACIYCLMTRRNMLAMLAFGVSFAFKLQAIFLAPLLIGMVLRRDISIRHVLAVPLVLFLAILPAWIAGRALPDLILVYAGQVEQFQSLQMNAPTVYAWLPDVLLTQHYFTGTGVMFAAALTLSLTVLVYKSPAKLSPPLLVKLALASALVVPFFLPKMHDRYFYSADVLSIVYAFFFPEYFFVPLVIVTCSFFAYQPHLFDLQAVPISILALGMFFMLIVVAQDAVRALFPARASAGTPAQQHDLQTETQP